jgi:peroxiredoxin
LVNLQNEYREKGLVVLGISLDDPARTKDQYIKDFCEKFKTNYVILRGDKFVQQAYFGNGGVALPTMFVIDQDGNVQDKIVGYSYDALEKSVGKLFQ